MKKTCAISVLVAATLASTGWAAGEAVLEEVVVTASKREQKLIDVSASVTAVSGEAIRELGITDISALARQIPGLQVQEYDLFPAFFIRGVGVVTEEGDMAPQRRCVAVVEVGDREACPGGDA